MSQLADDQKTIQRITDLEIENAELRIAIDTALRIVRDFASRNPIHEWNGVEQDPYGAHDWLEWYRSYNHCMCDACKNGVMHDACCAVHNEPAYHNGECDCEPGTNAKVGAGDTAVQGDMLLPANAELRGGPAVSSPERPA